MQTVLSFGSVKTNIMKHYCKNLQNMKCPFTYVTKLMLVKLRTAKRGKTHYDGSITYLCTCNSEPGTGSVLFHHRTGSNNLHWTKFTADVCVCVWHYINKRI